MNRTAAVVLLAVLAVGGCSSTVEPGQPQAQSQTTAPAPTRTSSTPPPSLTVPSTSKPVLPPAADGADVTACFDGTCEITVSGPLAIPLDGKVGLAKLDVTSVTEDEVAVAANFPGGSGSSSAGPGCTMTFSRNSGGSYCGQSAPFPVKKGLIVTIVTITGGVAVLSLAYA